MDVPYATPDEIQSWTTPSSLTSPSSTTSLSTSGTTSPSYWSSTESTSSSTETPITPFTTGYDYFSDVGQDEYIVAIVGIGYVGIHLVAAFSKHYKVIAFDINEKRIADMAKQFADMPNVYLTSDASLLTPATHLLVAVPTPLIPHTTKTDTSIIRNALETICSRVRRGATIIIESSVSVGMTRSLLGNMMKTYHINAGMSPERVDPGRIDPPYECIPKIISGLNSASLLSIKELYSRVFTNLILVSSPEVAEMTKLYENCQRMLCIAYANEMADACLALPSPIDPFEVSRAAATKPFGYLPFFPSAGVGGHCIPVNPGYLFDTSEFPLLMHATEKMAKRPAELADRAMRTLLALSPRSDKAIKLETRKKILVVGMAFKSGQALTTNSPGLGIVKHLLESWLVHVSFADPLVGEEVLPYVPKLDDKTDWTKECLSEFDAVIVVIRQVGLDFGVLTDLDGVLVEWYCQ